MSNLSELIGTAAANTGREYKLARAMGIPPQHVTNWKAGTRTCTPEDRARLAAFAGLDAQQELVRGVLEKHAGTLRGEQLARVLGKSLHQIGAVSVSALLGLASLSYGVSDAIRCILLLTRKRQLTS